MFCILLSRVFCHAEVRSLPTGQAGISFIIMFYRHASPERLQERNLPANNTNDKQPITNRQILRYRSALTTQSSPTRLHIPFQFIIECRFFKQVFEVNMHTVVPVVVRLRRVIDPFFHRILPAKGATHAHEVL